MDLLGKHGIGVGGSNIKSIQRGTAILTNPATTLDIAISSVDLNKAICLISYRGNNSGYANTQLVKCELTSSTNLRVTVKASGSTFDIAWQVIEFNNVKSIQRGLKNITTTSDSITISPVNMSKSFVLYNHTCNISTPSQFVFTVKFWLSDSSTISIYQASNVDMDIAWQVIEFN